MTDDAQYITTIVMEVLKRLGVTRDPSNDEPAGCSDEAASAADELVLDSRLVTWAMLDGKLGTMRRVVVPETAVVTPAVRDELRDRGIELAFARRSVAPASGTALLVARCVRPDNAVRAAALFDNSPGAVARTFSDLHLAVKHVAEFVADPSRVAALLTETTLAAACLANRFPAIRAAAAETADDVAAAIGEIGVNLLIVDPLGVTPGEWQKMMTRFHQKLPRDCPRQLAGRSS
jgi:hypothetical protein